MDKAATEKLLYERDCIKETLATPGMKFILRRLRKRAHKAAHVCLKADPYTEQDKIKESQLMRKLINIELPATLEWIINYDPEAPDKQVAPKKKWSFMEWMRQLFESD